MREINEYLSKFGVYFIEIFLPELQIERIQSLNSPKGMLLN